MPETQAYGRHGIVTLVYDKRTIGYSLLHRDYTVLAEDALGAVGAIPAVQTSWAFGQYLAYAGSTGSVARTMRTTAVRATIGANLFTETDFDPVPLATGTPIGARRMGTAPPRQPAHAKQSTHRRGAGPRQPHHTIPRGPAVNHDLHLTVPSPPPQRSSSSGGVTATWPLPTGSGLACPPPAAYCSFFGQSIGACSFP
jgi:hypothetical protein